MKASVVIGALMLPIAVPTVASGTVIHSARGWAAVDRGSVCEAVARSVRLAPRDQTQAIAGFAFSADRRRWGEFHARLRRTTRPGSTVVLTIGDRPFLLVSRGDIAWSRGPAQEQSIIDSARTAATMQVDARDGRGVRFRDTYLLAGAPTAIDAAAAHCAGKIRQR